MPLGVLIQRRKHNRKDGLHVVTHKVAEVLVVPEVKGTFGDLHHMRSVADTKVCMSINTYLEVRTSHRLGQLSEKRLLYLGKLGGVHHFEDVLYLIQVHDFLCAVRLRPVAQQTKDNLKED